MMKNARVCMLVATTSFFAVVAAPGQVVQTPTPAAPVTLKLRSAIQVHGADAFLADVLICDAQDAALDAALRSAPLIRSLAIGGVADVTHDQVIAKLREAGVNLGRVLVRGAAYCRIERTVAPAQSDDGVLISHAARISTPVTITPPGGPARNLADVIRADVQAEFTSDGGVAEIEFEQAGREFLDLSTPPWDFEVQRSGGDRIGLREFRVVIRRDGRVQRTARIYGRVSISRPIVVSRKPLPIGAIVGPDDVALETRRFERGGDAGLPAIEHVVGQRVKRFVAAGGQLSPEDLSAEPLVKRSRPVRINGEGGAVSVQLTGIALDNGILGDSVRIRVGERGKPSRELRGLVTGVGTVDVGRQ